MIQAGQWYHFAAVLNADAGSLAALCGRATGRQWRHRCSGILNNGGPLQFGHAVEQWDNGLTGSLDDIRIYNTARTQAAIQSDMLTPLSGTALTNSVAKGLVGYWNFNENGGNTVNDLTGNGNNGLFRAMCCRPGLPTAAAPPCCSTAQPAGSTFKLAISRA